MSSSPTNFIFPSVFFIVEIIVIVSIKVRKQLFLGTQVESNQAQIQMLVFVGSKADNIKKNLCLNFATKQMILLEKFIMYQSMSSLSSKFFFIIL